MEDFHDFWLMLTDGPLLIAFNNDDFVTAGQLLQSGKKIPAHIQRYDRTHIYGKIARAADFGLLNTLLDNGSINNDLYEYDELQYSIFDALFKYLPLAEASVKSLSDFIGKLPHLRWRRGRF